MTTRLLAEVFGFDANDFSERANHYRRNRLCPFHNSSANCTKDRATDPLGVCSIYEGERPVIVCPIRFREDWLILKAAADFFFPTPGQKWVAMAEVPLKDASGEVAGKLDFVLVRLGEEGQILDFGAVEVQAVYISGNIRQAFKDYMRRHYEEKTVQGISRYKARPDYLSSSRKRLVPQLLYKGGILKEWGKKLAVVLQEPFYEHLSLKDREIPDPSRADIAWLIFDLARDRKGKRHRLIHQRTAYTEFWPAMDRFIRPAAGPVDEFLEELQKRLEQGRDLQIPPEVRPFPDLDHIEP